jgi:hypothetical protein
MEKQSDRNKKIVYEVLPLTLFLFVLIILLMVSLEAVHRMLHFAVEKLEQLHQ